MMMTRVLSIRLSIIGCAMSGLKNVYLLRDHSPSHHHAPAIAPLDLSYYVKRIDGFMHQESRYD